MMATPAAALARVAGLADSVAAAMTISSASLATFDNLDMRNYLGTRPSGLFTLVSMPTGAGKTLAFDVIMRALIRYDIEKWKLWRNAGEEGPEPRRILISPTTEAWILQLAEHPARAFASSEATFLTGWSLRGEARRNTLTTINDAWSGSPVDYYRARGNGNGKAPRVFVPDPRTGMLILGQPDVVSTFLSESGTIESGLVGRTLIVHDDTYAMPAGGHEGDPDLARHAQRLTQLLVSTPWTMAHAGSDNADDALRNFYEAHLREMEHATELTRALIARTGEQASRIATILAAYEHADHVNAAFWQRGLQIARWANLERMRILDTSELPEGDTYGRAMVDAIALCEWLRKYAADPQHSVTSSGGEPVFDRSHVMQAGPRRIRSSPRLRGALAVLADEHWIRVKQIESRRQVVVLSPHWREHEPQPLGL